MITVTYQYYKNMYEGSLGSEMFESLLPKAQMYLNVYTNDKYGAAVEDNLTENMILRLRNCTCACIDCLAENTLNGSLTQQVGATTSETVGPWSVHKDMSSGVAKTASQAFLKTLEFYLAGSSFFVAWA